MDIVLLTDVASTIGYGKYGGTYKLATELRKHSYSCQVIDMNSYWSFERYTQLIDKFVSDKTILIGISTTLGEIRQGTKELIWGRSEQDFVEIISYIRSKNPHIKICAGGTKINNTSDFPYIDYAILGKADNALVVLADHLKKNTEIKFTQNSYTKIIRGDDYFYSQDDFRTSKIIFEPCDIIFKTESLPMEIARGCIFKCGFCRFDLIGKRVGDWTKDVTTVKEEVIRNYEQFGTTNYMFTDELINESIEKLEMLSNALSNLPFKIQYSSYARVDLIHRYPEMREMLLETGAASLTFGIETLNWQAGKTIGKGLHPDKTKETLDYCKKLWHRKVLMSSGFLVGLPGENEESIYETLEYLLSENNPLDVFMFAPLYMQHTDNVGGIGKSKFELDPKKYGYNIEKNSEIWTSDNISFLKAVSIVKNIYQDPRMKSKNRFQSASYLGRIMSLGYTIQDIFAIIYDMDDKQAADVKQEIKKRMSDTKELYFENLLNVPV